MKDATSRIEPLFVTIGGRTPAGHLLSGAAVAAAILLTHELARALEGATGGLPASPSLFAAADRTFVWGIALLGSLVIGGSAYVSRGLRRDLEALRARLRLDDAELASAARTLVSAPARRLALATVLGVAVGLVAGESVDGRVHRLFTAEHWGPLDAWSISIITLAGAVIAQVVLVMNPGTRQFYGLARDRARVELLDLDPLEPFGRGAVRGILPLTLAAAGVAVNATADALPRGFLVAFALLFLFFAGQLGASVFALRSAIREAKTEELARLSAALRGDRSAIAGSPYARSLEDASLGELLAYRSAVAGAREWIVDSSDALRFVAYVSIPVVSWLGSELLERALEATVAR